MLFSHYVQLFCSPMDYMQPTRLFLGPWDFPGKDTGVGCYFLLQGIFPTQGSNPPLLHWQVDSLLLNHQESPSASFRTNQSPIIDASCLKESHQHVTASWRRYLESEWNTVGRVRPLLSCVTFSFKILLMIQTLHNDSDSSIILHQNDRTFVLAPRSTLLMKNSKLLRPPSIKSKKELIQSNDRCMTTEKGFFFNSFKYVGCCQRLKSFCVEYHSLCLCSSEVQYLLSAEK